MKYIKKLIRNSKRVLNQQVIKKKQEIVKYAPRLTGIQEITIKKIAPPFWGDFFLPVATISLTAQNSHV